MTHTAPWIHRLGLLVLGAAAWCAAGVGGPAMAAPRPVDGDKDEEKAAEQIKAGIDDPEFMARVNAAIGRGVDHLLSKAGKDGKWASQHEKFQHGPYPHGPTALVLLALLKSGANRFDERIEKGFTYLKDSWDNFQRGGRQWQGAGGWRTYEVGLTIMALEALGKWKPPGTTGHKTSAMGGKLKRPELEWVKQLRDFLVEHQTVTRTIQHTGPNGTTNEEKKEMWHYPTDGKNSTDHSNSQYAVLGLKSASRLGYPCEASVWLAVFENMMFTQAESGPKVNRVIMAPRKRKEKEDYFRPHTVSNISDRARGWGYFGHQKPQAQAGTAGIGGETGSMTTVGIACVEIAWNEITNLARRDKDARKFVQDRDNIQAKDKAVHDGFAWLAQNFSVDENPGHPGGGWHFYYLYGLERAGVLANRINIGQHDWYRVGGEKILSMERGGSWESGKGDGPIGSTCFALLFLARSTVPLVQTTR